MIYDLIIIGAGAAGLFAAANVPPDWRVLLLEKTAHPGQKLLMAGSGQCNLTNAEDIKAFLTRYGANGTKLRPVLFPFSNRALMTWLEECGLRLLTRADGKVFPASLKSADVLRLFLDLAAQNKVELRLNTPVTALNPHPEGGFDLQTPAEQLRARHVLVTSGGASYPQTGSDGRFFDCLADLNIPLTEHRPALAPIYVHDYPYRDLPGVSIPQTSLTLQAEGAKPIKGHGDLLFTHQGFSGPVILTHTRYVAADMTLSLSYLSDADPTALRKSLLEQTSGQRRQILTLLEASFPLPRRFLEILCQRAGISPDTKASQLGGSEMGALAALLTADTYKISGVGGFDTAMVTAGGVSLDAVNLRTMESRDIPGLYFAGEVLDVDGDTGGYNLQFAFSSAKLAIESMLYK